MPARKSNKIFFIHCDICGNLFTSRRSNKKHCSDECYKTFQRNWRNNKKRFNKIYYGNCIVCNKLFTKHSTTMSKKTCCKECSIINANKISKQRKHDWFKKNYVKTGPYKNKCIVCGSIFISANKRKIYCSENCIKNSKGYAIRVIKYGLKEKGFNVNKNDIPQFLVDEKREYLQMLREYREQIK